MQGKARPRHLVVGVLMCAGWLAWSAPAQAAASWLQPATLTTAAGNVSSTAAGSDAQGNVVGAWVRHTGSAYIVDVATRTAGGTFSRQPLQSASGSASDVTVAVNGRGDAIIAWRRQNATSEIWAATRQAGGAFGAPQPIASVPGKNTFEPSTAINEDGAMIVVWRLKNTDTNNLDTIYGAFRPAGGSFSSAPISTSDTWNQSPRVALDSAGRATVVWSFWDTSTNIARVRIRSADGTLGIQRNLSAGAPTGFPMFATVGIDGDGNAVAVWSHWNGSAYDVEGASRQAASDIWTNLPPFGQSASASFGSEPQVAVDANGNAVAIWRASNGTIHAASRAGGGSFGAAQTGISAPTATSPRVVLDRAGNAVAIWRRSDGAGQRIESAVRPLGGQFGAVKTVSQQFNAVEPALSMDGLGNAFAVWPFDNPALPEATDTVAQFAAFDSSAPKLSSVSVPSSGVAGQSSSLSASASDVWSPVNVTWRFGDGASTTGASTSHVYGTPGIYTVTVEARDAVANVATTTRTTQISAPPPPGGGGGGGPTGLDADGDGFFAGQDCNDGNSAIRPGAEETRGNSIDENCDGRAEPFPRLRVTLSNDFLAFKSFTRLKRIQVKGVPAGSTVKATCKFKKKKCKGKARKAFKKKRARGTVSLNKRYKGVKLRVGTKITVTVTKPGMIGAVKIFKVRRKKAPKTTDRCLPPGARRPERC